MSALENTGPIHNSEAYTKSKFWENNEKAKAKKKETEKAKEQLKEFGINV